MTFTVCLALHIITDTCMTFTVCLALQIITVDKYQGQQNDYVLLSLVRSRVVGHLRDVRRLVVALSRARLGLYIFGRQDLFANCYELAPAFGRLLQRPTQVGTSCILFVLLVGRPQSSDHHMLMRVCATSSPKCSGFATTSTVLSNSHGLMLCVQSRNRTLIFL